MSRKCISQHLPLCHIMVTTLANMTPLQRSHTELQLVAAKRRNHFTSENLEVLYLLATINQLCLPRAATEYDVEIKNILWFLDIFTLFLLLCWKQSSRGVLMKMCSERYAVAVLKLKKRYWNHTLALVFSWEFVACFWIPHCSNTSGGAASVVLN